MIELSERQTKDNPRLEEYSFTDRLLAGWAIVSISISFLIAEWLVRPFGGRGKLVHAVPVIIALMFMVLSHVARGETFRTIGFRLDNFWYALKFLALPTLGFAPVPGCGLGNSGRSAGLGAVGQVKLSIEGASRMHSRGAGALKHL